MMRLPVGLTCAVSAGLGLFVQSRRDSLQALRERAERLDRERELLAQRAVAEEHVRIAQELHDVEAHNVSLIVVQAQALGATVPGERVAETTTQIAERVVLLAHAEHSRADTPPPVEIRSGDSGRCSRRVIGSLATRLRSGQADRRPASSTTAACCSPTALRPGSSAGYTLSPLEPGAGWPRRLIDLATCGGRGQPVPRRQWPYARGRAAVRSLSARCCR
jgi:Histidine kinase